MKYENFLEHITEMGYTIPAERKPAKNERGYGGLQNVIYSEINLILEKDISNKDLDVMIPALINSWHTGGQSGKSCWGGELHGYSTGDKEPKWKVLDKILKKFCPNISYLQFRELESFIEADAVTDGGDYYGNSSDYMVKYLTLKNLWNFMEENKLLENYA